MKNIKIALGSTFFAIALSGCMTTSNLTDQQKVDLTPYQEKLTQACVQYNELKNESASTCQSHSEQATKVMQKYYLLYNEDNIVKACKSVSTDAYTECLKTLQNNHYTNSVNELIEKSYSL